MPTGIDGTNADDIVLDPLAQRLLHGGVGHDPIWFLEKYGANILEPTAFEPDPITHRHPYYYNAVTNAIYQRVVSSEAPGVRTAHWKRIGG